MKKKKYALLALATMVAGANAAVTKANCTGENDAVSHGAISIQWLNEKCTAVIYGDKTSAQNAGDETLYAKLDAFEATVDSVIYKRSGTGKKTQTIVLPFDVSSSCTIKGADVIPIGKTASNKQTFVDQDTKGVWTVRKGNPLVKSDVSTNSGLSANTPYIVEFKSNPAQIEISNCEIAINTEVEAQTLTADNWQFIGTYSAKTWNETELSTSSIYGMAANEKDLTIVDADGVPLVNTNGTDSIVHVNVGDFVKAAPGASIVPMRAYLRYNPSPSNKPKALLKDDAVTSAPTQVLRLESIDDGNTGEEVSFPEGECFTDSITNGELTPGYKSIEFKTVNGKRTACIDGHSRARFQTVSIPQDVVVDTVIYNRQFPAGNYASTIMLPFSTYDGCTPATNFFTAVRLTNYGQGLVVDFGAINNDRISAKVEANTPYLVITDNETMTFKTACWTGSETAKNVVLNTTVGESVVRFDNWEFRGSYQHIQWNEGNSALGRVYGFASKAKDGVSVGQFVKGAAGASVPPMRAYLYYNKVAVAAKAAAGVEVSSLSDEELPETITIRLLDKDGTVMSIGQMNTISGEITMDKDLWFDLKGRKFNKKPSVKGTYYNQGRKVIIK